MGPDCREALASRPVSGELFYFSPQQNSVVSVSVQKKGPEISLGHPHVLFPIQNAAIFGFIFAVTSDGQRFLVSEMNAATSNAPLTLVMSWDADLKKK